jgi:hypothetical protein
MYLKLNAGSRLYASDIWYEFNYLRKTVAIILNQNYLPSGILLHMYVIVTYQGLAVSMGWWGWHLKLWMSHDTEVVWKVYKFYHK